MNNFIETCYQNNFKTRKFCIFWLVNSEGTILCVSTLKRINEISMGLFRRKKTDLLEVASFIMQLIYKNL